MTPAFSAVIRAKDREHTIGRAISSVLSQTVSGEIIVVDSGSSDRTVSIAASMGARIVEIAAHDFTYGRAINIGVEAARSEVVLILSAHCELPEQDWMERALRHFEDSTIVGLNGVSSVPGGDARTTAERPEDAVDLAQVSGSARQSTQWASFAGFSNHASVVRRSMALAEPFDENLPACEDKEWANRVVRRGKSVIYVSDLAVSGLHRRREGKRALFRRAVKESLAIHQFTEGSGWTWSEAVRHGTKIARSRRGLRRLAPLRPSNVVEAWGRVSGSRAATALTDARIPHGHGQTLLSVLRSELPPTTRIDLANAPLHNNCGDSAIWLGQLKALQSLDGGRSRVRRFSNILDQFAVDDPAPVVLVRGGGYLGDLWPEELRAFFDACARYGGRTVVFMPQSIGALGDDTLLRLRSCIERHGDVRLLLRDERSLRSARALLPSAHSRLAPDSAQVLTEPDLLKLVKQPPSALPSVRVIARSDAEGDGSLVDRARELGVEVLDFVDAESSRGNRALRWSHELVRARTPRWLATAVLVRALPRTSVYDAHARQEVRRAVELIAGAEKIVTDRLHASIIASLLEIHVVAVDTGYGKLRTYFDAWPSPFVTFADDVDAALVDARD